MAKERLSTVPARRFKTLISAAFERRFGEPVFDGVTQLYGETVLMHAARRPGTMRAETAKNPSFNFGYVKRQHMGKRGALLVVFRDRVGVYRLPKLRSVCLSYHYRKDIRQATVRLGDGELLASYDRRDFTGER